MNIRNIIILVSIIFSLFFLNVRTVFSADDILNIKISDFKTTLDVMQGECNVAPFHITNRYNESVHIYYRIDKPSDMKITSYPKDYTLLKSGEIIAGNLNVCVDEYFQDDTYDIKFWLETLTKLNESRVRSDRYNLTIKVLYNPSLDTTTTTIVETTTIEVQTVRTIPTYTTILTPIGETVNNNKNTNGFKIENLIDKKKLIIIGVIVILLFLVMIPYFTFKK